jgi:DNA-binding response OmpR family regulator
MNISIAIIDDEEDICFLLGSILKQLHHKVTFANTISEGKLLLREEKPSIIFLDMNLPDGSGMDELPYLKSEFPDAKIIMISAFDSQKERNAALSSGADVFLGKPFTRETIYEALKNI